MKKIYRFGFIGLSALLSVGLLGACSGPRQAAGGQAVPQGSTMMAPAEKSGSPVFRDGLAASDLAALMADSSRDLLLLDVRTQGEYDAGHIPDARLFPYDEIEGRAADFAALAGGKDRPIVVYCRSGRRSSVAAATLRRLGYTAIADFGGVGNWTGALER